MSLNRKKFRALRSAAPLKRALAKRSVPLYFLSEMQVTLDIPDDFAHMLAGDPAALDRRVRLDLAVHYYEHGVLSVGRAAEVAGVGRPEFERELASRNVGRPYSEEDLQNELKQNI